MKKHKLEVGEENRDDRTRIYTLSGCLFGSPEAYAFQEDVRSKIASGVTRIVIDLSAVEKIDSSGIGILVAAMWSASRGGAGLVLAALSSTVEKVLSIAMLLEHIDHAATVDDALASLDRMDLD